MATERKTRVPYVSTDTLDQMMFQYRMAHARDALYDPLRDGDWLMKTNIVGDPPPGRREIYEQWSRDHPDKRYNVEVEF